MHPTCPTCGAELTHNDGAAATWTCPAGHGAGITITAAYHHVQDDEIHRAWSLALHAAPGTRACPMCGRPMVVVDLPYDADELPDGAPGKAAPLGTESVDICTEDELMWFDPGEYEALPADLPDAPPDPEEEKRVAAIRDAFGQQLVDEAHERDSHTLTEHLYQHLARHRVVDNVAQRFWL